MTNDSISNRLDYVVKSMNISLKTFSWTVKIGTTLRNQSNDKILCSIFN